jgi:hypothetical protein
VDAGQKGSGKPWEPFWQTNVEVFCVDPDTGERISTADSRHEGGPEDRLKEAMEKELKKAFDNFPK